ncbi:MAG: CHAT domain-containing protein [Caldilinea sp. CFX5]|nr:CHAT domain-containing protein [Caldilinea sp. CFX5]
MLRATQLAVQVDLVRPGSWRALVDHLAQKRREKGVGYYQIIHFDLHGAVLNRRQLAEVKGMEPHSYKVRLQDRFARADLTLPADGAPLDERTTAWLFFEDEASDDLDAASAEEVAGLLLDHQIPIAILNACQSGQETGDPETGLGSRLLAAGVQTVVAMGYSVTVSAATQLMATLYAQLFQPPHDLPAALCAGRTALHYEKTRKAAYNQRIKLEDWLLPVLYQPSSQTPRHLPLREMSFDEQIAFYSRLATRYTPPEPEYGFVGRDVDILQIEKRLLRTSEGKARNLLLIQGMGGAGKSTLLRHLAGWWQTTGLVDEVCYFGYDERAYTLGYLLDAIGRQLLNRTIPAGAVVSSEFAAFQAMQPRVQATLLAQKLRSERHLLILDNLESVTGDPLAIPNTLPPAEQTALRGWLADLLGGRTLVLLGSRGSAAWLQGGVNPPLRPIDVYALPGLDAEAAANLAELILHRQVRDPNQRAAYAADPAFTRLLKLLDGSPLALEVVLSNLAHQSPSEILAALEAGDVAIDDHRPTTADETMARRTESILACIDYAYSNLNTEAQRLLLCLSPFTGVIWTDPLEDYTNHLNLSVSHFPEVLRAAQEWGLLTPHDLPGYLYIQPVLPYFLKTRLAQEALETKDAIETAFRLYYADMAKALFDLFEAKDPQQRQLACMMTEVEYENLDTALHLSLAARVSFFDLYATLSLYLDSIQDHDRGIDLSNSILTQMPHFPPETRLGSAAFGFVRVLTDLGRRQLKMQRHAEAKVSYQTAAELIDQTINVDVQTKTKGKATIYHELGRIVQAQQRWEQAERYYQQALAVYIEYNDRYEQAATYHQLGTMAQAQRQWEQAETYYQQALAIYIEHNDRHRQASIYNNLGTVAQEQRQWGQAEGYYQQALVLKIEFNDWYGQAGTYHGLGNLAYDQRQWTQAKAYYQEALALFIRVNARYRQAGTYHQLGRVAEEQWEWEQASSYYQKALSLFIEYNDRGNQAATYHQLGRVAQQQQQWTQASAHYQRALTICIEIKGRFTQAFTYHELGVMAEKQGQWDQAEAHYRQALILYGEFDDRYRQGGAYHQLGRVAEEQEQWQQAYDYFVRALEIYVEFADEHNFGIVQGSLRRLWQAHPDETVLPAIATVLDETIEGAQAWVTTTD